MPKARRLKSLDIELLDPHRIGFTLSLLDQDVSQDPAQVIHSLEVTGELSLPDLEIVLIDARSHFQPFAQCAASIAPVAELVGARIGLGFRARVLEVMGRVHGCTHFMSLMLDLSAAHPLSVFLRMRDSMPYTVGTRDSGDWIQTGLDIEPRLENACIALQTSSPVIQKAASPDGPQQTRRRSP